MKTAAIFDQENFKEKKILGDKNPDRKMKVVNCFSHKNDHVQCSHIQIPLHKKPRFNVFNA